MGRIRQLGAVVFGAVVVAGLLVAHPAAGNGGGPISVSNPTLSEGNSGSTQMSFTISGECDEVQACTISWQTSDGSAQDGDPGGEDADYTNVVGGPQFQSPNTFSFVVSVPILGDTEVEPNEAFSLTATLRRFTGSTFIASASGTGTILNDDISQPPSISVPPGGACTSSTGSRTVVVSDDVTPAGSLSVSASSSNPSVATAAVGGTGGNRTITVTPNLQGSTFLQVNVTDGDGSTTSISLFVLVGSSSTDTLTGQSTIDFIFGRGGGDRIDAGDGDDLVCAGDGNDSVVSGESGDDTMDGGTGTDVMDGGDGNDILRGGDGPDTLVGNAGDDTIVGGLGNDTMFGAQHDDTMTGNAGADRFSGGTGTDTATDFSSAQGDTKDGVP